MQNSQISRAKQFLPFDALKGLQEALREKEVEYDERKDLSEETLSQLDTILNRLENGSKAKIKYYNNYKYNEIEGIVTNIDTIRKKIQIHAREPIDSDLFCGLLEFAIIFIAATTTLANINTPP